MDRRFDIMVALGFVALGLLIIWQATLIRSGMMRDPVGPRAAFYLCGGVLVAGGLLITLRHWLAMRAGRGRLADMEGTGDTEGHPASLKRPLLLIGCCLAYAALFQPLGYLLATPPFVLAALAALDQRRWVPNLAIALGFTLISYAVFAIGLGVRMPHGPLTAPFRALGWISL
ncbi:MAG: tripartite tricarboxylate transporter TctB family protein [Rhodobacteraceae bacterium]|nr:tripartite tricarboxylate transporter TctB family protein [Paracoccaceae bacterium]